MELVVLILALFLVLIVASLLLVRERFRKQRVDEEELARRAAVRAIELAAQKVRGERWGHRAHS